jgi:hypothetical protein
MKLKTNVRAARHEYYPEGGGDGEWDCHYENEYGP